MMQKQQSLMASQWHAGLLADHWSYALQPCRYFANQVRLKTEAPKTAHHWHCRLEVVDCNAKYVVDIEERSASPASKGKLAEQSTRQHYSST